MLSFRDAVNIFPGDMLIINVFSVVYCHNLGIKCRLIKVSEKCLVASLGCNLGTSIRFSNKTVKSPDAFFDSSHTISQNDVASEHLRMVMLVI